MWYVGLDVHWRTSTVCILDENGRCVKRETLRRSWDKVLEWLEREAKQPFAICYEASCSYGYLYDGLGRLARRVVVAHPGQLRLIFRSKRKSDRVDAEKLAKLLFLNEVPPVYVPRVEVRSWRQLIEMRRRLIDKRTRTKNGLRAFLRSHGLRPTQRLWSKAGLAWVATVQLPTAQAALGRDLLLEELRSFNEQVQRVTQELDRLAAAHPAVAVLRTIPGVGPRTAEAVVAYIDDPGRFAGTRRVGSYFGLVPCQDDSADARRQGHITCQGPPTVRKLLAESAWQVIRHSPRARQRFERIMGGKTERKKVALVATAHWACCPIAPMTKPLAGGWSSSA